MRVAEIEEELPNGFHDTMLIAMHRNLAEELATLDIKVLVGLPDEDASHRDRFRNATLFFREAKVVVIDSPDPDSPFIYPGASSIVITEDEAGAFSEELLRKLPKSSHTYAIFVRDWLSNIRIAAACVDFEWK